MRAPSRCLWLALTLCAAVAIQANPARAASTRYCDQPTDLSAAQKDRLLQLAGVIKASLDASGHMVALVSRSGLDLARFGVRYSHAGLSLKEGLATPWAVRQLYYACDEQRPRVFDQGLTGFLLGLNDPAAGHVSVVLLPADAAAELQRALLDRRRALQLLAERYSANAYAFGTSYQNCNQWVAEMLAAAWGGIDEQAGAGDARARAQQWLRAAGYQPTVFEVHFPPLPWLGSLVPWLHHDDHPAEDLARQVLRVSMPAAIEDFVRHRVPGAQRIEFCHDGRQVVVHHGWQPIAPGCRASDQDTVVQLD